MRSLADEITAQWAQRVKGDVTAGDTADVPARLRVYLRPKIAGHGLFPALDAMTGLQPVKDRSRPW